MPSVEPEAVRVSVEDGEMHARVWGSGPWTVVLDAGWGRWSPIWYSVQESLADRFRTVAIDRLGLGRSTPGPLPRTSFQIVDETQAALQALGLSGPYLLVAEGFAAVHARIHAFREEAVKGLVLVDPVTEVWARSKSFQAHREMFDRQLKKWTRRAGLRMARTAAWLTRWPVPGLPKAAAREMRGGLASENFFGMRAELGGLEESLKQLATVGAPTVPTTVISPEQHVFRGMPRIDDGNPIRTMQLKLSQQAPEGRHVVVAGQDRCLPVDHADAVAEAVTELASRLTIPVVARS